MCLFTDSKCFRPLILLLHTSVGYQINPLSRGNNVGNDFILFGDDLGLLKQDTSNRAVLLESQFLPFTKMMIVRLYHVGF